jgi:hypothetical protein
LASRTPELSEVVGGGVAAAVGCLTREEEPSPDGLGQAVHVEPVGADR